MHVVINIGSTGTDNSQKNLHTTLNSAIDVPEIGRGEILRTQKNAPISTTQFIGPPMENKHGKWPENIFIFFKMLNCLIHFLHCKLSYLS